MNQPRRYIIIGEGTLAIQCGELIFERGDTLIGVVSSETSLQKWAKSREIPIVLPTETLKTWLAEQSFDYIFSIVNTYLVNEEVLKRPGTLAINYQDAPLPRYAGTHPTSWAILNRESSHGVTWHLMNGRAHEGNILAQRAIVIDPGETALSLNLKCFDAAVDAFDELLDKISQGAIQGFPQDAARRTIFPRTLRPPDAGMICWHKQAKEIDALVRALYFGDLPNPLGLPKMRTENGAIIVSAVEVLDKKSEAVPGTLLQADADGVVVMTGAGAIALRQIMTIDGEPLSMAQCVSRFALAPRQVLPGAQIGRLGMLSEMAGAHEEFWLERLESLEPIVAPLPRRGETSLGTTGPLEAAVPVPKELDDRLAQHPGQERQNFLVAAFGGWLGRLSGVERFDLGFSGRGAGLPVPDREFENLFARHVPLRFNMDPADPVESLLGDTRIELDLITQHGTFARDMVARFPRLRSSMELRRQRKFSVAVELVGTEPMTRDTPPPCEWSLLIPDNGDCRFVFDAAVVDSETASRLAGQFAVYLKHLANAQGRTLGNISILSEAERHQLLVEWNQTQEDYPRDRCVHQLFEEQAGKTPNAVAVTVGARRMTYRELNEKSNQLAHHLKKMGVGPEVLVGLCVRRSFEMMIGILGVLKAGGAYVPLDPTYPRERLAYMLRDTQTPVLLAHESLLEQLPGHGARAICLDTQWHLIAGESSENLPCDVRPHNLVYVIYTSGSTGRPKGAMILHGGLVNYLAWAVKAYGVREGRGAPVHSSISFDLTVTGLFAPLLVGNTVELVLEDLDVQGLVETLQKESNFSLVKITPAHLELLSRQLSPQEVAGRTRSFIIGGENLLGESIAFWQNHAPDTVLVNEYGPTETVVGCCVYHVPREERRNGSIPIGRPIANTQLYILDARMEPVAVGMVGELYIGGDGVGRGYLNQPEISAERFLNDPFSPVKDRRLYKTGDLRYLPDANIEFLGRIDHQVKVRGYRIELGEIESILKQQEAVRDAVVLLREETPGDARLIAYIVPRAGPITQGALRETMRRWLPAYMIPWAFVFVDTFPLTPNGKLDRKALPLPENRVAADLEATWVEAHTKTQTLLVAMWEKLLGIQRVGIRDNFFDLGGYSLLAVRLIHDINRTMKAGLGVLKLFQNPTIEQLAAVIDAQQPGLLRRPKVVTLKEGDKGLPVFFVYAGPEEIQIARSMGGNRPIYGIEAPWPVGWREAATENRTSALPAFDEFVARFTDALTAFQGTAPCVLAGYSFAGVIAFEVARQLKNKGGTVDRVFLIDSAARHPSPRQIWWHNWRREGKPVWQLIRFLLGPLKNGALKMLGAGNSPADMLEPGSLTALLDDSGAPIHWGVIMRMYHHLRGFHVPQALDTKGVLFRASMTDQALPSMGETLGWEGLFSRGLKVVDIPGNHHSAVQMPDLLTLVQRINEALDEHPKQPLPS